MLLTRHWLISYANTFLTTNAPLRSVPPRNKSTPPNLSELQYVPITSSTSSTSISTTAASASSSGSASSTMNPSQSPPPADPQHPQQHHPAKVQQPLKPLPHTPISTPSATVIQNSSGSGVGGGDIANGNLGKGNYAAAVANARG